MIMNQNMYFPICMDCIAYIHCSRRNCDGFIGICKHRLLYIFLIAVHIIFRSIVIFYRFSIYRKLETDLDEYRITNRGGKGVKTINITEKTGKLISIQAVTDENDLMIINRSGLTIRTAVDQIRVAGRATQGVRIINLREGDAIASVIAVPANEEEEPAVLDGAGAPESESEENVSKEQ